MTEETLGRRIARHRKRICLTQDALAEKLGVTAQAVSKWENDQSCPDITMLPRLAEIFDVTTDRLLGRQVPQVRIAEVVAKEPEETEPEGIHFGSKDFEFQWDGDRRSSLGLALWIILSGFLLFLTGQAGLDADLWEILWTTGLTLFGLFGLFRSHFSFYRLACAFLGGYFLCTEVFGQSLDRNFILPVFLMCFGFSLFLRALKKPKHGKVHLFRNGRSLSKNASHYSCEDEAFTCETSFGENDYLIQLPRLSGGAAQVSFGSMTVDLSGCEEIGEDCRVELGCAFGELTVLIPRKFRTELLPSTAFGNVEEKGTGNSAAPNAITLCCDVSFGQITVRHI